MARGIGPEQPNPEELTPEELNLLNTIPVGKTITKAKTEKESLALLFNLAKKGKIKHLKSLSHRDSRYESFKRE